MNVFGAKDHSSLARSTDRPDGSIVETDIPARLDHLPWGPFHTRVVVALGVTWVLDGLEVTIAGAISGALRESSNISGGDRRVSSWPILLQKSAILVVGLPLRPLEADFDYSFSHWTLVGV